MDKEPEGRRRWTIKIDVPVPLLLKVGLSGSVGGLSLIGWEYSGAALWGMAAYALLGVIDTVRH